MKKLALSALVLLLINGQNLAQTHSYKVKYGLVQAGSATLVHEVTDQLLSSALTIESSPWLSNLWTLSDTILTAYHLEDKRLMAHTKAIHEGNYHRHYDVSFDDTLALVNGKEKKVDLKGLVDLPSLLYQLTFTKFRDGDTLRYRIWDGRSSGKLELLVEDIGKPTLLKPFLEPGWKLTPLSSTRKSRANGIQVTLLYSKEYPHTPVKIEIDTKYGNVHMLKEEP